MPKVAKNRSYNFWSVEELHRFLDIVEHSEPFKHYGPVQTTRLQRNAQGRSIRPKMDGYRLQEKLDLYHEKSCPFK